MSASTSLVRVVLACAEKRGVAPASVLGEAGIEPAVAADKEARVPTGAYLRAFAAAVRRSESPLFGADAAACLDTEAFGLLGFVVASSATLRDALGRFARYTRLLCDELRVAVVERGDEASIVYVLDDAPHVPALFEMALTHLVQTARRGTKGAFRPERVVFRHRAAHPTMSRILGAEVVLGGAEDAVHCARAALDLPLRGANPTLLGILEAHAAQVLRAMPDEDDVLARTRVAIRTLLPLGEPSLAAVAARLGVGERTLQRRLRELGATFRTLVDDVRRDHAVAQLAVPGVSVAEVAFSLGFSGPSAFHHAYRRWTGRRPGERA